MHRIDPPSRRRFLAAAAAAAGVAPLAFGREDANQDKALVAISLDLEMSRNFPRREDTHWDYHKGDLNAETKAYAVEAARRVKAAGGVLHFFAVGQVFEQEDVNWLKGIIADGHPVGNHSYDHVNVLATRPEDVQFRFQRAPWLIEGRTAAEAIRDNVRLGASAMKARLGRAPDGFRTPGGFHDGLRTRPDVRAMLLRQGYKWVSSVYPPHEPPRPLEEPAPSVYDSILAAQAKAQPFVYDDGLIEVPMSPISDIGAFRTGQWRLEWFLRAIQMGVEWAVENRSTFDFLGHPSCLYVVDPEFRTVDLICEIVRKAGARASLVGLDAFAERARAKG